MLVSPPVRCSFPSDFAFSGWDAFVCLISSQAKTRPPTTMTITTTPFFNFQDFHVINKEERGGDGGSPVRRANKARRWGALLGGRKAPPALERGFLRCGRYMPGEAGTLGRTGYLSLAVVRPYAMSWTAHALKYLSTYPVLRTHVLRAPSLLLIWLPKCCVSVEIIFIPLLLPFAPTAPIRLFNIASSRDLSQPGHFTWHGPDCPISFGGLDRCPIP